MDSHWRLTDSNQESFRLDLYWTFLAWHGDWDGSVNLMTHTGQKVISVRQTGCQQEEARPSTFLLHLKQLFVYSTCFRQFTQLYILEFAAHIQQRREFGSLLFWPLVPRAQTQINFWNVKELYMPRPIWWLAYGAPKADWLLVSAEPGDTRQQDPAGHGGGADSPW